MNKSRLAAFIGVIGLAVGLVGCAAVTPTGMLSNTDISLRDMTRVQALENNKTGEASNWSNAATGSRGTIVPTRTYKSWDGRNCREFRETVTAGGNTDFLYGAACRTGPGTWVIVRGPYHHWPRDDYFYDDPDWPYGYGYGHFGYWHRFP